MRFRLFRSRAFWLGVPGLVFLVWGWWVSMGHVSEIGFTGPSRWWIAQNTGEVNVSWHSGEWPDRANFYTVHREAVPEVERRWKMELAKFHEGHPIYRCVFIPNYAVIFAYVAVCGGFVFLRSRKYRALPETD